LHWFFRGLKENESHAIAGRNSNEFASAPAFSELRRAPDNLGEALHQFALFVDEQLRVTDCVDKQDVCGSQMGSGFPGSHV
jgi:hypothetical protein